MGNIISLSDRSKLAAKKAGKVLTIAIAVLAATPNTTMADHGSTTNQDLIRSVEQLTDDTRGLTQEVQRALGYSYGYQNQQAIQTTQTLERSATNLLQALKSTGYGGMNNITYVYRQLLTDHSRTITALQGVLQIGNISYQLDMVNEDIMEVRFYQECTGGNNGGLPIQQALALTAQLRYSIQMTADLTLRDPVYQSYWKDMAIRDLQEAHKLVQNLEIEMTTMGTFYGVREAQMLISRAKRSIVRAHLTYRVIQSHQQTEMILDQLRMLLGPINLPGTGSGYGSGYGNGGYNNGGYGNNNNGGMGDVYGGENICSSYRKKRP